MNETVDQRHEDWMATTDVLQADPGQQNHSAVVVNVQEADVSLLFLQHEKNGVEKVKNFSEEVVVGHDGDLNFVVVVGGVIDGLAEPAVTLAEAVVITID